MSSLKYQFKVSKDSHVELMSAKLDMLVLDEVLVDALKNRNRQQLLALSTSMFKQVKEVNHITHFSFLNLRSNVMCSF